VPGWIGKKNACDEKKAGKKCVSATEPPWLGCGKAIDYVGEIALHYGEHKQIVSIVIFENYKTRFA
jgi:hypothetical protein